MNARPVGRPVDQAMAADRSEKRTIRTYWINAVSSYRNRRSAAGEPLYLTLSGAEGTDIERLAEAGIIERTETGSIAPESFGCVVAVESSIAAFAKLQRKFAGLEVIRASIRDLLQGDGLLRYPQGRQLNYCRARVINLDLDQVLKPEDGS